MPVNGNVPQEQLLIDVAEYSPVLPDVVTQQLLSRAGLDTETDPRIARISALAAQKVMPVLRTSKLYLFPSSFRIFYSMLSSVPKIVKTRSARFRVNIKTYERMS